MPFGYGRETHTSELEDESRAMTSARVAVQIRRVGVMKEKGREEEV